MNIVTVLETERLKFLDFISMKPLKLGRSYNFEFNGNHYSIIGSYSRLICLPGLGGDDLSKKTDTFYEELALIDEVIQEWIDFDLAKSLVNYFTPDKNKVLAITLALSDRLNAYTFKDSPVDWVFAYMALCVVSTVGVKNSNLYMKWLYCPPSSGLVYIEDYLNKEGRGKLIYRGRMTRALRVEFEDEDKGGRFLAYMYQKFYITPQGVFKTLSINNEVLNLRYNARANWILRSLTDPLSLDYKATILKVSLENGLR